MSMSRSATSCWVKKEKFMIVVDRLFREEVTKDDISIDGIYAIIFSFFDLAEMRFSAKWKSKFGWRLSDGNKLVQRIRVKDDHYSNMKWILADTEPMKRGKHCWRVQIKNPRKGWMSIGVAQPNKIELDRVPFGGKCVFAIGLPNTWYPSTNLSFSEKGSVSGINWSESFRQSFIELDIFVDLKEEEAELRICSVDNDSKLKQVYLRNKQKSATEGWLPYFNAYYSGAIQLEFKAVFIDPEMYSIPVPQLFQR